jgi:RimJ/RimL family protein N-acetyltransferase
MNIKMEVGFYSKIGFQPPWVGYLATMSGVPVGLGAFKGSPSANKVEVAYFTFPEKEGQGLGTQICGALVEIARSKDPRTSVNRSFETGKDKK